MKRLTRITFAALLLALAGNAAARDWGGMYVPLDEKDLELLSAAADSVDAASDDASMIPLRIVFVTSPPASTAPENSNTAAMISACLIVMAREPTEVAIALATSLAPMPQAMNRPKAAASAM